MDSLAYQTWQALHERMVVGEALSSAERSLYDAGCRTLDAEEYVDGDLARLLELRTSVAAAERERVRLREREADLESRIASLEARLAPRTRQQPGIR